MHELVERYPGNIRCWRNIAAVGELTAIDMTLNDDFGEMIGLGLIEDIEDFEAWNYYRVSGVLNVHAEYGYLVNEVTATRKHRFVYGLETRRAPPSSSSPRARAPRARVPRSEPGRCRVS